MTGQRRGFLRFLARLRGSEADGVGEARLTALRGTLRAAAHRELRPGDRLRKLVDSEDLTQEALLRLLRSSQWFQGDNWQDYLAFAGRVLRQVVADRARAALRHKRGALREEPLPETEPPAAGPGPSGVAARGEERRRVEELMTRMPESLRQPLGLRLTGVDYAGISRQLGVSEAAARQRVSRALAWLRVAMSQPPPDGA